MKKISALLFTFILLFLLFSSAAHAATGPSLTSSGPSDDETDLTEVSFIGLYFDQAVVPGTGKIHIWKSGASQAFETIDVVADPGKIYCDSTEVMILPGSSIPEDGGTYYVLADAGTLKDASTSENWEGLSSPTQLNFTMRDSQAPQASALSPVDGASGVSLSVHPAVEFNEAIILTGTGACSVVNKLTSQETSCAMNVSESTLTLTPASPLDYGTQYYIIMTGGPVSDTSGNAFGGLTSDTDWEFTTEAEPSPPATPVLSSSAPGDDETDLTEVSFIGLYFDQAVVPGTGKIYIWKSGASQAFETIDVVADPGKIYCDSTEVMILPGSSIPEDGGTYYVLADAGTLKDASTSENWEGLSSPTQLNFTMKDSQAPQASSLSPVDGASGVSLSVHPAVEFNEAIILTGTGACSVVNKLTSQETSCAMNVSESTLTLTPASPLDYGTQYYIIMTGGPVSDTSGNAFGGLTSDTDWEFTTEEDPNPTLAPSPSSAPTPAPTTPPTPKPTVKKTPKPTAKKIPKPAASPSPSHTLVPLITMPPIKTPQPIITPPPSPAPTMSFPGGMMPMPTFTGDFGTLLEQLQSEQRQAENEMKEAMKAMSEKEGKQERLEGILGKLQKGTALSEQELASLVEMGIITEEEKAGYANSPGTQGSLTDPVISILDELNKEAQVAMMQIQNLQSKYNQTTSMIANMMMKMSNPMQSIVGNLHSDPKYSTVDEDGCMMFSDVEYGEHSFMLYNDKGECVATVSLRLENDADKPVSSEWVQEEDGTWVFNTGGNTVAAMFDANLAEKEDGTLEIEFTKGTVVQIPESKSSGWLVILLAAAGAATLAIAFILIKRRKKTG